MLTILSEIFQRSDTERTWDAPAHWISPSRPFHEDVHARNDATKKRHQMTYAGRW